jgi:hypothetical protein
MILRSSKVIYKSETMAAREEIVIDSQEDMTQYSDEQIPGISQIIDKETSGDNLNKEMLNMMHDMFNKLEEYQEKMNSKLEENQKNQERMNSKLEENIKKMNNKLEEKLSNKLEVKIIEG